MDKNRKICNITLCTAHYVMMRMQNDSEKY